MNRKYFLSSLLPESILLKSLDSVAAPNFSETSSEKVPAYLAAGDTIGITCPAGYITKAEIEPAVIQMKSWGFNVVIGNTVDKRDFTFGGTDQERLADMQLMLDDPQVKAIMCARGGYGAIRILDQLDFRKFRSSPKWLIGFSDITVFHSHINTNYGIATIHSKMCNSFPADWALAEPIQVDTINSIRQALSGEKMSYASSYNVNNRLGVATGELIGGNLRCVENLAGSRSEINTDGKILFLEDTGEYLYSIDRMFYNLKRSGKLAKLKGLIIGGFKIKVDTDNDGFSNTLNQIVLSKVAGLDFPVCFDFPVGHQRANYALKCGVKHKLEVWEKGTTLVEV